jgi:hypothetical protein
MNVQQQRKINAGEKWPLFPFDMLFSSAFPVPDQYRPLNVHGAAFAFPKLKNT